MSFVKLRGLPWSCSKRDVVEFLSGCRIKHKEQIENNEIKEDSNTLAIYFLHNQEGKPTGEAFVELCDEKELELALKRHNRSIGHRYIEVFRSNREHFEKHLHKSVQYSNSLKRKSPSSSSSSSNCLIGTSVASLADYDPANIHNKRLKSNGKHETRDCLSYIENVKKLPSLMSKKIEAPADLTLKNEPVVPIVPLLDLDLKAPSNLLNVQQQNPAGLKTQFGVRMRGLPYSATESDVRRFFSPLQPIKIVLLKENFGGCECFFNSSKEVDEAMKYHKNYMSNRYIELFKMPSPNLAFGKTSNVNARTSIFSTRNPKKETTTSQNRSQNRGTDVNNRANRSSKLPSTLTKFSPIQLPNDCLSNRTPVKQNIFDNSFCNSIRKPHSTPNLTSSLNNNQLLRTHAPSNLTIDLQTNKNNNFFSNLYKLNYFQQNLPVHTLLRYKNNQ